MKEKFHSSCMRTRKSDCIFLNLPSCLQWGILVSWTSPINVRSIHLLIWQTYRLQGRNCNLGSIEYITSLHVIKLTRPNSLQTMRSRSCHEALATHWSWKVITTKDRAAVNAIDNLNQVKSTVFMNTHYAILQTFSVGIVPEHVNHKKWLFTVLDVIW